MNCPTCSHSMCGLGLDTSRMYWCPRCGTIKSLDRGDFADVSVPYLADRVRTSEEQSVQAVMDGRDIYAIPAVIWAGVCEAVGVKAHGT